MCRRKFPSLLNCFSKSDAHLLISTASCWEVQPMKLFYKYKKEENSLPCAFRFSPSVYNVPSWDNWTLFTLSHEIRVYLQNSLFSFREKFLEFITRLLAHYFTGNIFIKLPLHVILLSLILQSPGEEKAVGSSFTGVCFCSLPLLLLAWVRGRW